MLADLIQALLLLLFDVFLGRDDNLLAIEDVEDATQQYGHDADDGKVETEIQGVLLGFV